MTLSLNKLTPLKIKFHRVNQEAVRALPLYNMMYTDALSLLDTSDPSINIKDQCNFCLFELMNSQNKWITFKIGITINSKLGKTRETKVVYHRNILYIFDEYDLKHPLCDKYDRENEEYIIVDGSYNDLMEAVNSNGSITVKSGRLLYENDNKGIFSKVNTGIELGYKDSYRAETILCNKVTMINKALKQLDCLDNTDGMSLFNDNYFIDNNGNSINSIFGFGLWHVLSNSDAINEMNDITWGMLPGYQLSNRICNFHNTVEKDYLASDKSIQTNIIGLLYLNVLYEKICTVVKALIKSHVYNDGTCDNADLALILLNEAIECFNITDVKVHIRGRDDPRADDSYYEAYMNIRVINKWIKDAKSNPSIPKDAKFKRLVEFLIENSDDTLYDDISFASSYEAILASGENLSAVELDCPCDYIIDYKNKQTDFKNISPQLSDVMINHLAIGYLDNKNKTFLNYDKQDGSVKPKYSILHTIGKVICCSSEFYYISFIEDIYLGIIKSSKKVREECSDYLADVLTGSRVDFIIKKYVTTKLNIEHFSMMYKCLKDKGDIIILFMEDN